MRAVLLLLIATLGSAVTVRAQGVVVAPHAVVIDHGTRSAAITLYNPGSTPAEVRISGFFGYPATDSAGEFELVTPAPGSSLPSAAEWIDAYPRRVIVGPLERQTVRLLGRPPAGLPDGEYWSRLLISARGGRVSLTPDSTPAGISVGLDLEVRTVIPVQYRKGHVDTGVRIEGIATAVEGDSLAVRVHLVRTGNAAYIGTLGLRLVGPDGTPATQTESPLAVYLDIDPRFTLPLADVAPGTYRLHLDLQTRRADLPPEQIIPADPVRADTSVVIR